MKIEYEMKKESTFSIIELSKNQYTKEIPHE